MDHSSSAHAAYLTIYVLRRMDHCTDLTREPRKYSPATPNDCTGSSMDVHGPKKPGCSVNSPPRLPDPCSTYYFFEPVARRRSCPPPQIAGLVADGSDRRPLLFCGSERRTATRMKRLAFKLVVFLLLGALVNVAVAWECARQAHFDPYRLKWDTGSVLRDTDTITFLQLRVFGASRVMMNFWVHPAPANAPSAPARSLPYWVNSALYQWDDDLDGYPIDSAGIPLRCLRCLWTNNWILYDGVPLHSDQFMWVEGLGRSALPTRVIWPGFLINTLFYAAILCTLWSAPFTARRLIRGHRCRCVKCGYDLRHAEHEVCPECGSS